MLTLRLGPATTLAFSIVVLASSVMAQTESGIELAGPSETEFRDETSEPSPSRSQLRARRIGLSTSALGVVLSAAAIPSASEQRGDAGWMVPLTLHAVAAQSMATGTYFGFAAAAERRGQRSSASSTVLRRQARVFTWTGAALSVAGIVAVATAPFIYDGAFPLWSLRSLFALPGVATMGYGHGLRHAAEHRDARELAITPTGISLRW